METNFVVVDAAARQNSTIDSEGYSLLPDIVWSPGPDMYNSQYGKVIFTNVRDSYETDEDLLCMYNIMTGVEVRDDDRIGIFCVGWANIDQIITWVLAAKHPWPNKELSVTFSASQLPAPGTHFYQFCYLSAGEVRGASIPFNFVNKYVNKEQQNVLYLKNPGVLGTSPETNSVSTGGVSHSVADMQPQNLTVPTNQRRHNGTHLGTTSDELMRTNTAEVESSCSQVTSSEQYAPNSQNEKQKNINRVSLKSTYKDHDTLAGISTSQGLNDAEMAVPPYVCIQNDSEDPARRFHGVMSNTQNGGAQVIDINSDLQRKFLEMQHENQMLLSTVKAVSQENATLRFHLNYEVDKSKFLIEKLQRIAVEVQKLMHEYDVYQLNSAVVAAEFENEISNQRLRIEDMHSTISDKDKALDYYSERFGVINERALRFEVTPQFQGNAAGHTDEQLQQEGHVHTGANNGMQKQNIRASTAVSPFRAALRKAKNYYVTFLSDKDDIEHKVFALNVSKLSIVVKVHSWKEKKISLMKQQYQYITTLQEMAGVQNEESRRILKAVSKVAAEQRELDDKAFIELDVVEEIKRRLEINRQNACILKKKSLEVFIIFLESYNHSMERYTGEAHTEVERVYALYAGLDARYNAILNAIGKAVCITYLWD